MTALDAERGVGGPAGLLDRERTIARAGFNRWLVPPAALAIHLCIGMAYGFSVFWLPLSRAIGLTKPVVCADVGFFQLLFSTTCDWKSSDLGWMYTLFFVVLGSSAALWGGWLERAGPRKAGVVAAFCWCGGLLIGAIGVATHQLWMLLVGPGIIGGIGLGLGYISPVSTLIKWFPDRRGMATGMAIMGFGGGALIGSPLANWLMNGGNLIEWKGAFSAVHFDGFKSATEVGVWQTFMVLAIGYFIFMIGGALSYRVPPAGWRPEGWTPAIDKAHAMITAGNVHLKDAHKTPQFWLIWLVLCMNVSAGIGVIGAASPMLQETFGGRLFGDPSVGFGAFSPTQKVLAASVGAAFVGLFSLFNIGGRFFWASMSDRVGRKQTYFIFFILGILCYGALTTLANAGILLAFAITVCIIASMYGGGFATVPAYLADMFGTQYVGAIHGRLLTAWSTAGILGPVIVNYLHDSRVAAGVPADHVYDAIFYGLVGLLVIGLIANLLIRPVAPRWFMRDEEVAALQAKMKDATAGPTGSFGIGTGGLDAKAVLAWAAVGIPLLWGVFTTLTKVAVLFQ